jgi:hypothetical protein
MGLALPDEWKLLHLIDHIRCNGKSNICVDGQGRIWQAAENPAKASNPLFTVSYGVVEQALVQSYGIEAGDVTRFRSRLGALQKGGLLDRRPGKGIKLVYGPPQFYRLVFACELTELGVPPSVILRLVDEFWDTKLAPIFAAAEAANRRDSPGAGAIMLVLPGVSFLSDRWPDAAPAINKVSLGKLAQWLALALRGDQDDWLPPRALIVNLSARLRKFHAALVAAHNLKEPVEPLAAPPKQTRARKSRR